MSAVQISQPQTVLLCVSRHPDQVEAAAGAWHLTVYVSRKPMRLFEADGATLAEGVEHVLSELTQQAAPDDYPRDRA